MMSTSYRLNFARSWRPRTFGEVVGQAMPVRLLSNSLAREIYFPVYLLSGMRGSGKTSVGRLFAAALNCDRVQDFRAGSYSWSEIPCGKCKSCLLMQRGEHPDFIEVDAASYTGVENIRQIIDEAQFLPVVGGKKIYLVDEAHMLSKSAFNAFLKMLEEPPVSVVFLLATTEAHKILDTVRSRSFQLFFDPLPSDLLAEHLLKVAQKEGFSCTPDAAALLAQQSEGSVRDALTALEQAVMSGKEGVTVGQVQELFGLISYPFAFDFFNALLSGDLQRLFDSISLLGQQKRSFTHGWSVLVEIATGAMWLERSVCISAMESYRKDLANLLASAPVGFFPRILDIFFKYEPLLQKTQQKMALFERMIVSILDLLRGAVVPTPGTVSGVNGRINSSVPRSEVSAIKNKSAERDSSLHSNVVSSGVVGEQSLWDKFLSQVKPLCSDPILFSVLSSGHFDKEEKGQVYVVFPKTFAFYEELLISSRTIWQVLLEESFGEGSVLVPSFAGQKKEFVRVDSSVVSSDKNIASAVAGSRVVKTSSPVRKRAVTSNSAQGVVDISDAQTWPVAHELVKIFPGSVRLYEE